MQSKPTQDVIDEQGSQKAQISSFANVFGSPRCLENYKMVNLDTKKRRYRSYKSVKPIKIYKPKAKSP